MWLRNSRASRQPWLPLLGVAIVASVLFGALNGQFFSPFNLYVVLSSASLLAVIGFSQLVVLGVGEFSLAVGGIGEFSGVVIGHLLVTRGVPLVAAVIVGLLVGVGCGLLNGVLVAKSGVSGFVITLATGGAFGGAALAITETAPYTNFPEALNLFGAGRLGLIPYVLSATLLVAVALAILYRWLRSGRIMLAVGGNAEAARLSGLSKTAAVILAHGLSGLIAAVAGVMTMAQLHEANPMAGSTWLIQSFTVPIIGGTSLTGGAVSVVGTLVAALILATINDGLILIQVNPFWVTLVEGALVFLAVLLGQEQVWQRARTLMRAQARDQRKPVGQS